MFSIKYRVVIKGTTTRRGESVISIFVTPYILGADALSRIEYPHHPGMNISAINIS